jgi:hypothetical protein
MTHNRGGQGESQGKSSMALLLPEPVANIRPRAGGSEADIGPHFKKARFMEGPTHDADADASHVAPLRASGIAESRSLSDISAVTSGARSLSSFATLSETSLSSAGSVNNCTTAGLDATDVSEPKYIDFKKLIRSGSVKSAPTLAPLDDGFCRENRVRFDMLSGNTQFSSVAPERMD